VYAVMGNEEAVIQTGEEMERLARRRRCFAAEMPEVYWQNLDQTRWDLLAVHAVKGDIESDPLEHWGQAHERLGEHTKAKEKYRIALGLDLSDADRRLLQGYCG
ncbi:MAG: hypothetical protein JWN43_966, partial [Gammaproteobacteria bacterium]|nr:hypothetical protein [Gammaproteobacteria bacterium]